MALEVEANGSTGGRTRRPGHLFLVFILIFLALIAIKVAFF